MCESNLEDMMAGSHMEEVYKKVLGRELDPPAKGRG